MIVVLSLRTKIGSNNRYAKRISLSEAVDHDDGAARLGKRWSKFGFRRFKKYWRAFATRAKAHSLDQNWHYLAGRAQRSDHWAKNANLTCRNVNHCDYKVWLQKKIHNQKNMMNHSLVAQQLWCWVPQRRYDLGTLMKCVCKALIYHPPETQHFIMIRRYCSRLWML